MKNNGEDFQRKRDGFFVSYPVVQQTYMVGKGKDYHPKPNDLPYYPIFTILPNSSDNNWIITWQDSEKLLYDTVNQLCNLTDFNNSRHIMHINNQTIITPSYVDIMKEYNTQKSFGNEFTPEHCRCIMISNKIRENAINKYGLFSTYNIIFSCTFKRYFTDYEWQFFYKAPFQKFLFDAIDIEIHKAFRLFQVIITFNYDAVLGYPYIEVLISNRILPTDVDRDLKRYTLSRYKNKYESMKPVTSALDAAINNGIIFGSRESINYAACLDEEARNRRQKNSYEEYMKLAKPSISNMPSVTPELQSRYNELKKEAEEKFKDYPKKSNKYYNNTRYDVMYKDNSIK